MENSNVKIGVMFCPFFVSTKPQINTSSDDLQGRNPRREQLKVIHLSLSFAPSQSRTALNIGVPRYETVPVSPVPTQGSPRQFQAFSVHTAISTPILWQVMLIPLSERTPAQVHYGTFVSDWQKICSQIRSRQRLL